MGNDRAYIASKRRANIRQNYEQDMINAIIEQNDSYLAKHPNLHAHINDTLRLPSSVPHPASCILPKGNGMLAFDGIRNPELSSNFQFRKATTGAIKGTISNLYLLVQEQEEAQDFS